MCLWEVRDNIEEKGVLKIGGVSGWGRCCEDEDEGGDERVGGGEWTRDCAGSVRGCLRRDNASLLQSIQGSKAGTIAAKSEEESKASWETFALVVLVKGRVPRESQNDGTTNAD
ncbi:hypothetical protein B0H19DRAFT_1068333 [Mycena capillaripes]|nr:hypothetical protein B0H19DRAFT_1068333 [Mycena capillaripes]